MGTPVAENMHSTMNNNVNNGPQRGQEQHQQQQHPGFQPQHPQFQSQQRQFVSGSRPMMMPAPVQSGNSQIPIVGQKRDRSGFVVGSGDPPPGPSGQDSADGGDFIKLFVGSVPKTITEDDVRPLFAEHGNVLEVALIRDKWTGEQQVPFHDAAHRNVCEMYVNAVGALINAQQMSPKAACCCCNYTLDLYLAWLEVSPHGQDTNLRMPMHRCSPSVGTLKSMCQELVINIAIHQSVVCVIIPTGLTAIVTSDSFQCTVMNYEFLLGPVEAHGCCFIKYATVEEADRAIKALHNQRTLPGEVIPIHVRYADGERERLGAMEHKLFVGSLNKQATENEIEEIFARYGCVDDIYIMRDEHKQSRGCAFVKYASREMAVAAINALNGTYEMKGCDHPLSVRFAEPKRPRGGDTRLTAGVPGIMQGRGLATNWRPMGGQNMGPLPHANPHMYGRPLSTRPRPAEGPSSVVGRMGGPRGPVNRPIRGPVSGPAPMGRPGIMNAPSQRQGFIPSLGQQQIQVYGQQVSQMQQQLQAPVQQQLQSYSQLQHSQQSIQQYGQPPQSQQIAHHQLSYGQAPVAQLLSAHEQLVVSQPQVQRHVAKLLQQATPISGVQQQQSQLQQLHLPITAIQQHQPQPQPLSQPLVQLQPQPQPQSHSQQQSVLPIQQLQPSTIQSNFLSQQCQPLQQQQQFNIRPPEQCQQQPDSSQHQQQQTFYQAAPVQQHLQQPWEISQQPQASIHTLASRAQAEVVNDASVVNASTPSPALTCNWSEHTSPEGYKYYYNSVTGESTWEKPAELTAFEQQQREQPPTSQVQQSPLQGQAQQSHPKLHPQVETQAQAQQQQAQFQKPVMTASYSVAGMVVHQPVQNHDHAQLQGVNPAGCTYNAGLDVERKPYRHITKDASLVILEMQIWMKVLAYL
eukprot:Gb_12352 [translate_table: standard]